MPSMLPMAPFTSPKETFVLDRSITLAAINISNLRESAIVLLKSVGIIASKLLSVDDWRQSTRPTQEFYRSQYRLFSRYDCTNPALSDRVCRSKHSNFRKKTLRYAQLELIQFRINLVYSCTFSQLDLEKYREQTYRQKIKQDSKLNKNLQTEENKVLKIIQ